MSQLPRVGGVKVKLVPVGEKSDYRNNSGGAVYAAGFDPTHVIMLGDRPIGAVVENRHVVLTRKYLRVGGTRRNLTDEIAPHCYNGLTVLD